MTRKLIINADDMGYTAGVNRAILQCFMEGGLSSSTLLAKGQAFEEAVDICKATPDLGIGVHLALTEMPPAAPQHEIQALLTSDGLLPPTPGRLLLSLKRGKIQQKALVRELDVQVSRVVDAGVRPTHLDSHKHLHAIPEVLEAVIQVARRHAIRWIRNPFEASAGSKLFPLVGMGEKILFCKQHAQARIISIFKRHFLRRIGQEGLRCPDHFSGVSLTGIWNEAAMIFLLQHLPHGTSEWMLHPAFCDEDLSRQKTRLLQQRQNELDLLLSPRWRDLLRRYKIALVPYGGATE
jgi:predicted glycoside hydrolase/deacetylase ChbG (UPF0249 family)